MTTFNYSRLIESGDKVILYDPDMADLRKRQVAEIQQTYEKVRSMLETAGLPTSPEWVEAIANEGAEGLKRIVAEANEKEIERLKIPSYMAASWRTAAQDSISPELMEEADAYLRRLSRARDGVPFYQSDLTVVDGTLQVNVDAVVSRIEEGCRFQVTQQIKDEAKAVEEIVVKLRKLQEGGVDAMEVVRRFMGNWLSPKTYPKFEPLAVYKALAENRHVSRLEVKRRNPDWYYIQGGQRDED